jgi:TRAP transporter TAXI family solute receptor
MAITKKKSGLKFVFAISVLSLMVAMQITFASTVGAKEKYTFGTSPMGGTWYPQAAGLAELWNKTIPTISVTVDGSGGSVKNPKMLEAKKIQIAMTVLDVTQYARTGQRPYKRKYDLSDVRSVILMGIAPTHIVVLDETPIYGLKDLKGKRVSIGDRGASSNTRVLYILGAAGLTKDDIKIEYIGDEQARGALNDGRIDCWAEAYGVPAPGVLNLATTRKIRLLELTKEEEARLMKKLPFMNPFVIPAGTYGKGQSKDVVAYGVRSCLMVRKEVPEATVYEMCKSIDENWDYLHKVHKDFKLWKFDANIARISQQPLHPGALKFYKEKGLIK